MTKLGYRSSAIDALQGADLTGKVCVVTGKLCNLMYNPSAPVQRVCAAGRRAAGGAGSGGGGAACAVPPPAGTARPHP